MKQKYFILFATMTFVSFLTQSSQSRYTVFVKKSCSGTQISLISTNPTGQSTELICNKKIWAGPSYRIKQKRFDGESFCNLTNEKIPEELFVEELLSTGNTEAIRLYNATTQN